MSKYIEVKSQAEYSEKISRGVVLVDFWAPWCGPCRMVAPVIETIAEKNEDVTVLKVNTDENQDVATDEGIRSIPTLTIYKDGVKMWSAPGVQSESFIQAQLDLHK